MIYLFMNYVRYLCIYLFIHFIFLFIYLGLLVCWLDGWWDCWMNSVLLVEIYVPPCIHLFPHARADIIQVLEHEHNFSKFDQLTISFLVP